jgi:hypothetical protein
MQVIVRFGSLFTGARNLALLISRYTFTPLTKAEKCDCQIDYYGNEKY